MKAILVLLLGCLPLAVLTASSFLELRSTDGLPAARGSVVNPPAETGLTAKIQTQLKAEKPLAEGLGDVDLLSSETLRGLKDLPAESSLSPLKESWPQWVKARQLVDRSMRTRQGARTDGLDQLKESCRRLEELKAEYEKEKPAGGESFLALLDRQIASLKRQIAQATLKIEADALLAQARADFEPKRYGRCASVCEEWLVKYSELDAALTVKVRALRDRARFSDDVEQVLDRLRAADSLARRKAVMEEFLAKYPDRTSRTAKEQEILDQCQAGLAKVNERIRAEQISRDGADAVSRLRQNPPAGFLERVRAAADVRRQYPAEDVNLSLRRSLAKWLAEVLPEKQLEEPAELREAENKQGEIMRGFFREVKKPDGSLLGYQVYSTFEEYVKPRAQVGTYPKEEFVTGPGQSAPRRCAGQYNGLREELLAGPARRAAWEKLAALCEESDAKLSAYRKKPGSSKESLSFAEEARFARQVLSDTNWNNMEVLFGSAN